MAQKKKPVRRADGKFRRKPGRRTAAQKRADAAREARRDRARKTAGDRLLEKLKRAGLRPEGASHEGDLRLALEEGADVKLSGDVRLDGARALRDRLTAALTALGGGALPGYADALEDTPGSRRVVVRGTSAGTRDLLLEPTRQGVRVWLEIAEPGAPLGSVLAAIGSYAEIPLTARRS